jgi:hypothetical protein
MRDDRHPVATATPQPCSRPLAEALACLARLDAAAKADAVERDKLRAALGVLADRLNPGPPAEDVALFRAITDLMRRPGEVFSANTMIRLLATEASSAVALAAVIGDAPENRALRFGLWLNRMVGVEIDGLCVRKLDTRDANNSALWMVDYPARRE